MGQYKYLKDRQHYIDLFDRFTVEKCRRMEKNSDKKIDLSDKKAKVKKEWEKVCTKVILCFVTGEEYTRKEKTIDEWMERDAKKDEFLDKTELSINPYCLNCKSPLVLESKNLFGHDDEHVLFFYGCTKCNKARGFFENGEEYIPEKTKCPKCGTELTEKVQKESKKLTIFRHCDKCGLDDDFVYEDEKKENPDPDFIKDRKRFCLSREEGQKYLDSKQSLEYFQKFTEEQKGREKDKPLYDQVEKLDKLTVVQLKQLLQPELEKAGYTSLAFSEPKIDRHVIIDFKVEDSKEGRVKYDSIQALKRVVRSILDNTNWNLMTNGPDYRLGVLSGQLKGLESESDLLDKIKNRKPLH